MPRRVVYVTGNRADFGLAVEMLRVIDLDPRLELKLIVTGEHLVERQGFTASEVRHSGLPIAATVDMLLAADTARAMAAGVGLAILGITPVLESLRPDVVLVLGDRGEMLAAALSALHLGLFVAHLHGGEHSGTVDGAVRHAVSSLAHFHFAATAAAADWLVRRGEPRDRVFHTGAPGLDAILSAPLADRAETAARHSLDADRPWAIMVHHPDTISGTGLAEIKAILAALRAYDGQLVLFEPNSDAGREAMASCIRAHSLQDARLLRTAARRDYLALVAHSEFLVGNSSSGIIETPSLGIPFVCVGHRQDGRERGGNVIDVPAEPKAISAAIVRVRTDETFRAAVAMRTNPYGDGSAGRRVADLLATVGLGRERLQKDLVV